MRGMAGRSRATGQRETLMMKKSTGGWTKFFAAMLLGGLWSASATAQLQKSAQSDCMKEAVQRGYQVLSTGNFQQYRDGWSMDIQVRDARGRVQSGTCFVETKTGDVSLYGLGWGGGVGSGGGALEFNCASSDERYRECQLPVDGRARLVKQRSDAPCIEGRSWGQRGDRVWVDKGCRARFTVTTGGGGGGGGQGQQQVSNACRAEAQRRGMYVQSVARAEWNPGGHYWLTSVLGTYQSRRITAGCRWYPDRNRTEMNFGQGWVGGGGWSGGGSSATQAERACQAEAQRLGYRVIGQHAPTATQNGYTLQLRLRRGNGATTDALCRYDRRTGRAQLEVYGASRSGQTSAPPIS